MKTRKGLVRCGRCSEVFRGDQHLVDAPPSEKKARKRDTTKQTHKAKQKEQKESPTKRVKLAEPDDDDPDSSLEGEFVSADVAQLLSGKLGCDALQVSQENTVHNAVSRRYQSVAPEFLPPTLQADIVLANILAQPLMELAPKLAALVRNGGNLILSGLLESQASAVCAYYAQELVLEAQVRREDAQGYRWVMLAMSKRHPAG